MEYNLANWVFVTLYSPVHCKILRVYVSSYCKCSSDYKNDISLYSGPIRHIHTDVTYNLAIVFIVFGELVY